MSDYLGKTSSFKSVKVAFRQIILIWRPRFITLFIGCILSIVALLFGLALMSLAGGKIALTLMGGVVVSSVFLKILGTGRVFMRYIERLYTHNIMFKALSDLRVWFFRTLAKGSAAGLGFKHSGDMLSRLVSDIDTLDSLYLRIMIPLFGSVLTELILLGGIGFVNIGLGICIGVLYALSAFIFPLLTAILTRKTGEVIIQDFAKLRIDVLDFLVGLREIRAFGVEKHVIAKIQFQETLLFKLQFEQARVIAWSEAAAFLCGQLAVLILLAAALGLGFSGITPLQTIICLFLILTAFNNVISLNQAGGLAGQIANAAVRIVGINQIPSFAYPVEGLEQAPIGTDITFRDVAFRWDKDRNWVYESLNLSIQQGSRIAIIGPSGAGKSTLAALLLKVIAPQKGSIELGGRPLSQLQECSVRKQIGWLSQNTHLFDDTIRQNLLLGNPEATEEELWQALTDAAIAEDIRSMPDGLDSWLGEGGIKVSGGQGRRIALARTLLSKAPILLLDEPTTGLDLDTEKAFFQTLNQTVKGQTIILITHRLTGVEKLDQVWCLSSGCLTRMSVK